MERLHRVKYQHAGHRNTHTTRLQGSAVDSRHKTPHTPALALMHVARLEPDDLEEFVFALVEDAPKARRLLGDLLDTYVDPPAYFELSS
ncbi:MAG: hypothetical protein AAGI37_02155 [Planctomycetota bacterium]